MTSLIGHLLSSNVCNGTLKNPFKRGTVQEIAIRKRGKFNFDHTFVFLTIFLKKYTFFLDCIFFGSLRESLKNKNMRQFGVAHEI